MYTHNRPNDQIHLRDIVGSYGTSEQEREEQRLTKARDEYHAIKIVGKKAKVSSASSSRPSGDRCSFISFLCYGTLHLRSFSSERLNDVKSNQM